MALIEVKNLVKDYKINVRKKGLWNGIKSLLMPEYTLKRAVNHIQFSIEKGEMVGFIGPNGAGKSTTVKMLTGILVPTDGIISVKGFSPHRNRKKYVANIGVVFGQKTQLWWDLPTEDTFDLLKYIYKIPEKKYQQNMGIFNELLGINEFLQTPVRQLSLGQRMRADIAAALLHDPEIVFFDEPTIGLDVIAKEKIRQFIKQINIEKNITMLFTTHDMIDIEKTCQRMLIIDQGIIIYDGSVSEIKRKSEQNRLLSVEFSQKVDRIDIPGVEIIKEEENKKLFKFNKNNISVPQLIALITKKHGIVDLTVSEPEIEAIIREIYEGGITLDQSVSGIR